MAKGTPIVASARMRPRWRVEERDTRVDGVERIGDDDMRDHLHDKQQQHEDRQPAQAEDDQRVGGWARR